MYLSVSGSFIFWYIFLFLISIFSFQLVELLLSFPIRLIYWWWTFACSENSMSPSILNDSFAGYCFFELIFCPLLCLLSFLPYNSYRRSTWWCPLVSLTSLFLFFSFSLMRWIPQFCPQVYWFSLPLVYVESLCWFFSPVAVSFRFVASVWCLKIIFFFYLFIEIPALFTYCSPDRDEHVFNNYFKLCIR